MIGVSRKTSRNQSIGEMMRVGRTLWTSANIKIRLSWFGHIQCRSLDAPITQLAYKDKHGKN